MKLVQQKYVADCVICANAMIHDISHEEVMAHYATYCREKDPYASVSDVDKDGIYDEFTYWLANLRGVPYRIHYVSSTSKKSLMDSIQHLGIRGPHILTVESLNVPGGLHVVVIDDHGNVLDPQNGVIGRQWYEGPLSLDQMVYKNSGHFYIHAISFTMEKPVIASDVSELIPEDPNK